MAAKLKVLTKSHIDTFQIHEFIYHILDKERDSPDYLNKVSLTPTQRGFFKDIILECARGTQYDFRDSSESDLAKSCRNIVQNPNNNFIDGSKEVAKQFSDKHAKNALYGIVVVSRVTMEISGDTKSFIAILKVDYTKVLQQIRDKSKPSEVSFKEIVDSLSEEKRAIQKKALIDVENCFDWDILALERNKTGQKIDTEDAISIYFQKFLTANLKVNGSTCSKRIPGAVNRWAQGQSLVDSAEARTTTVALIKACDGQALNVDRIRDAVCANTDENTYRELCDSFDEFMEQDGFNFKGREFVARAGSISPKDQRTTLTTNYGVTITYEGSKESANVKIDNLDNGQSRITIIADNVENKL